MCLVMFSAWMKQECFTVSCLLTHHKQPVCYRDADITRALITFQSKSASLYNNKEHVSFDCGESIVVLVVTCAGDLQHLPRSVKSQVVSAVLRIYDVIDIIP